jgi:nicotinamide-nucleotide amidase
LVDEPTPFQVPSEKRLAVVIGIFEWHSLQVAGSAYRLRAKEAEEQASKTRDPSAKQGVLDLARQWRELAEQAERQGRPPHSRSWWSLPPARLPGMSNDLADIAEKLLASASRNKLTVVTAESCPAGLACLVLSDAPGAAEHFHGGFVTYNKPQKTNVFGVSPKLLDEKGAVCPEVARAMAEGALMHSAAELAVAITGVAGPEPDEDGNPVGRVCIALSRRGMLTQDVDLDYGDLGRDAIRKRAVYDALKAAVAILP